MAIIPTEHLVLGNIGEDGVGKTVTAVTISKQCPKVFPPQKPVHITDTFWFAADPQALASARAVGITVDNCFDLPLFLSSKVQQKEAGIVGKAEWTDAVRTGLMKLHKFLIDHHNGNVVIDTLSAIAGGLQGEFARAQMEQGVKFSVNAPDNTRDVYGRLKIALSLFADHLNSMPFGICLILVHTKALQDMTGKGEEGQKQKKTNDNVRKAGKSLEGAEIIADVEGSGFKYFLHPMLMLLPIIAKRAPGSKVRQRFFCTNPATSGSRMVKLKFEGILKDEEPANWLSVIEKINRYKRG